MVQAGLTKHRRQEVNDVLFMLVLQSFSKFVNNLNCYTRIFAESDSLKIACLFILSVKPIDLYRSADELERLVNYRISRPPTASANLYDKYDDAISAELMKTSRSQILGLLKVSLNFIFIVFSGLLGWYMTFCLFFCTGFN